MFFCLLTCRDVPCESVFSRTDEKHMGIGRREVTGLPPPLPPLTVARACGKERGRLRRNHRPQDSSPPQKLGVLVTGVWTLSFHRNGRVSKRALDPGPALGTLGSLLSPSVAWSQ